MSPGRGDLRSRWGVTLDAALVFLAAVVCLSGWLLLYGDGLGYLLLGRPW